MRQGSRPSLLSFGFLNGFLIATVLNWYVLLPLEKSNWTHHIWGYIDWKLDRSQICCSIMSPVADYNLASYMEESINSADKQSLLRTFFGCLCNGLQYLQQSKIRHRDVKPENILVKGENVLLTDFGISLDWEDMSRSTTSTDFGHSLVYCALEVANFEPRNSSSDIWSLGCRVGNSVTLVQCHRGATVVV